MLSILHTSDPDLTYREDQHPFVECSTFADDIKYHGGAWQSDYHFYTIPYISEGDESDYDIDTSTRTLVIGVQDIVAWLSGK